MKKDKGNRMKHMLAAVLFCVVMSIGFVCFADEQATVNVESAKIRASADSGSEQLGSVPRGKTIDIISKTTGADGKTWYQVYVDANTKGYIRGDLVKLKDGANVRAEQPSAGTAAQNTDTTPTAASAVEAKKATVVTNNVRIRKGASTSHDVVATANKGMVLTVTGEADGSDGKKWYQVSFTYSNKEITGFIRSDMVTFDNVPADVAESQITGDGNPGGEQSPQETEPQDEIQEPESESKSNEKEVTPMEVDEKPYVMPGFVLFDLLDGGEKFTAYKNGNFYIFYGRRQDGEEGWFLFDADKGVYTRYPYTSAGVEMPGMKTVSIITVIVLVIIIVILVALIGLLLIKLKENVSHGRSYGRNTNGYQDDDVEDLEELEDEDEDLMLSRPQGGRQPQGRRPQPQGSRPSGGSPQPQGRRPQPQGGKPSGSSQLQERRPQPQGGTPQGSRPSGGSPQPQGRRPQPQGGRPSGSGQPQGRRPQPQNEKVPSQKGYKAKNLLEEDDDMNFMDI